MYLTSKLNLRSSVSSTSVQTTRATYEELSREFKNLYPTVSRAFQLISLMYDRLTMVDNFSHKEAISKIYEDHKHLPGFSQRNIRRSLMSLDNPNIPHRNRKIRPSWPNSDDAGAPLDVNDGENTELPSKSLVAAQNYEDLTRKAECSNCRVLLLQCQGLEKERSKVVENYEQALQIIKEQQDSNQPVINIDTKVLEQEIALLYGPLQQAMASAFKLKENRLWLTIKLNKNTGNIIAVYTGRKSNRPHQSQSISSNQSRV
jgi:hypothetical protein